MTKHPYHIVDYRPWPLMGAVGSFCLVSGAVCRMYGYGPKLLCLGIVLVCITIVQWWRDVVREATFQGKHTAKVERGLRLGMLLFICSEVFFFVGFF